MRRHHLWLIAGSLLIFLLSYYSINSEVGSDPKLTLLVSQALIDHRTIYLDAYVEDTILERPFYDFVASGDILLDGEHYSHYFPIGPSLLSVPIVGLARLAGWDMRTPDNYHLQEILSALTAVAVFVLGYALARCYVAERPALAIAFVSVLGSSLISTLGTAFWSHNPAVLFISGVLWLLARVNSGKSDNLHPLALGTLLFLAFMCRASAVAFILPVFGYLALRHRRDLLPVGGTALALLLLYLFWTYRLTGAGIAAYYSPARLAVERSPLWVAIAGNLVSPSRGIFIFSPFLLVVLAGYLKYRKALWRQPMVWMCLVWFGSHLVVVARAASWWGGWAFGPRLLTDLWPGIIVLTAIWWAAVASDGRHRSAWLWGAAYLSLALPAILIHSGLGLFSQPASRWNGFIDPLPQGVDDLTGSDLFNWRYAQVMATNSMLCRIEREKMDRAGALGEIPPGEYGLIIVNEIGRDAARGPADSSPPGQSESSPAQVYFPIVFTPGILAHFLGWTEPTTTAEGASVLWSECDRAEIRFYLVESPDSGDISMAVRGKSFGRQRVSWFLNDTLVGEHSWAGDEVETQTIHFPSELLREGELTVVSFSFPDARYPSLRDQRPIGLALQSVTLRAKEGLVVPMLPVMQGEAYPAP